VADQEVLWHVLRGRLNKQIASDLVGSRADSQGSVIFKLNVRSVAALVWFSQEAGVSMPKVKLT